MLMITRILQWLREVWSKMITPNDVKQNFNLDIAISQPMIEELRKWSRMYVNQTDWLRDGIKSMNLPAAIAGEISRLTTIEMKVGVVGSPRADFLQEQLNNVVPKLRQQVEYACAKGGMMMKPYVVKDQIVVDFIQADQFYPIAFDANGNITACVFSDQRFQKGKYFTRLEYHQLDRTGYMVRNQAFISVTKDNIGTKCPIEMVEDWSGLLPEATIQGVTKPLFAYFRFPAANNIDPSSPLGVSCYAKVVDLIQMADVQWADLLWEFESGKRALYVDTLSFDKGADGKPILPHRRLYRTLNQSGAANDENLFEEWSPDFREQNLLNGLDAILRKIEFNVGLAYGTLSNPATVDKTATELKISQQRSYGTVTDTQKALTATLEQLLFAMDVWVTINKLAPKGVYHTTFDYDDSVITDKDTAFQQDLRLVTTNIMSKVEFRMRNFKEDEETATARVKAAEPEPLPLPGFGNKGGGMLPKTNANPATKKPVGTPAK